MVIFYADSRLVIAKEKWTIERLDNKLRKKFVMKDLWQPKLFLGMYLERNKSRKANLRNTNLIEKILHQNEMNDSNAVSSPTNPNIA